MTLGELLGSPPAMAALAGAVAGIFNQLVGYFIGRRNAEMNARHAMRAKQEEIRFGKYHDRMFKVMDETYQRLVTVLLYIDGWRSTDERRLKDHEEFDQLYQMVREFTSYTSMNAFYYPAELWPDIASLSTKLLSIQHVSSFNPDPFIMVPREGDMLYQKYLWIEEAKALRATIRDKFRDWVSEGRPQSIAESGMDRFARGLERVSRATRTFRDPILDADGGPNTSHRAEPEPHV